MTSNIGAGQISKNVGLGFSMGDESGLSYDDMKNRVMSELKKVFRPELLNRIDEIIVFHKLTREEITTIVDLQMKRVREQIAQHDVVIELTDEAKDLLVEQGYDPAMGARPLRRAIQRVIEDPLADFVLGRSLEPGSTILVGRKRNEDGEPSPEVDITIIPGEVTPEKVTVPPEEPTDTAEEPEEPEPVE
jgi:ATP-dependent Clp protease ATP-binding subunit ClpC